MKIPYLCLNRDCFFLFSCNAIITKRETLILKSVAPITLKVHCEGIYEWPV